MQGWHWQLPGSGEGMPGRRWLVGVGGPLLLTAVRRPVCPQQQACRWAWGEQGEGHLAPGTTTAGAGRPQTSALQTLHTCTVRVQEGLVPRAF